jgi:hypothetical protein
VKSGEQLSEPNVSPAGELLFHAGFGGTAHLIPSVGPYFHGPREQYEDIIGADPSKPGPNAWDQIAQQPNLGGLRIYYEGGDASQRWARIVPDESDPKRKVLRFCLVESNVTIQWPHGPQQKGRVQAELYGNTDIRAFYQTVRLRLHSDMRLLEEYPKSIGMAGDWLTLFEFWNRPWWSDFPYPFRISVGIVKTDPKPGTKLFFSVHGRGPPCRSIGTIFRSGRAGGLFNPDQRRSRIAGQREAQVIGPRDRNPCRSNSLERH